MGKAGNEYQRTSGIGGKGGGRPNLAQGSLPDGAAKDALGKVGKALEEKLK
ncbi:MAG: hypothetical protein HY869_10670 [Chloroflexi bacterium]|nr:hypothetical protein [Chloroflexota bacterium]